MSNNNQEDGSLISTLSKDTTRTSVIFVVLGWQFVAFLLALINVFSELLTEHNWRTPTLMNAPMYLLLFMFTVLRSCIISKNNMVPSLTHSSIHRCQSPTTLKNTEFQHVSNCNISSTTFSKAKSNSLPPIKSYHSTINSTQKLPAADIKCQSGPCLRKLLCPTQHIAPIYYIFAAIADVEGNVFLLTAYEYTTITSVSLLDCFTIPMVLIWGIFIFGRKYSLCHYAGIFISLSGMILLVYADSVVNKSSNHGINPVFGDILVLCGCVCYSISNSFAEYVVKHYQSIWRYLRMIGLYGFIITLIQGLLWEHKALFYVNEYCAQTMLYLFGYVLSLSVYYVTIPVMLQHSSAVVFNLSLLSADFWAVLAAVFLFSVTLNYLYFIAFTTIICGVIWYNISNHILQVDN